MCGFIFLQNGETATHVAARFGNLKTLLLLINEKADTARRSKVISDRPVRLRVS